MKTADTNTNLTIKQREDAVNGLKLRANNVLKRINGINPDDLSEAQINMLENAVIWQPPKEVVFRGTP